MTLVTHTFLRTSRDEIVREWEALVEREPRVVRLADAVLRNHVPALLDELAEWMEGSDGPGEARMRAAAVAHASHRLDQAFQVTQLIQEVRLLRMTILRLLLAAETAEQEGKGTAGMRDRVTELARLNAGLDYAIADAVEYFVNERERRLLEMSKREAELAREADLAREAAREAERAHEAERRKSEFLAVLSHELRNPLAPIRNGLYILARAQPGSDQASRARDVIHRQTEHLTRLVDDLLNVTRISRGKIELHLERFDLREAVRRTCDDHRSVFEQREIDLRLDVPAGPVWIDADPTRISEVVSNLLHNAAKFTGAKGNVNVVVDSKEGRAVLCVRDDGVGMEQSLVEHAFEPFVQVKQDQARKEGGLGLGLALVKGLASLHGGSVSARSGGLGLGSEFVVELPLASGPCGNTVPDGRGSRTAAPRLVLIIEDNLDAAQTLAQVLAFAGHGTRIAHDGRSGIALARRARATS